METTALAVLAMIKTGQFTDSVNKGLVYLIKSKDPYGTWGSTQATILALKALTMSQGGAPFKGEAPFTITVNGKEAFKGIVNEQNADLLQQFDLKDFINQTGDNKVSLTVKGETNLMYQIVSRHYEPWGQVAPKEPVFDVGVAYDRTKLSTADLLRAKATLKYNGKVPTSMVMLDLGIPPGFTVDAGDFAEMVGAKKVKKFSVTSRQVILYLGDVKPGEEIKLRVHAEAEVPAEGEDAVVGGVRVLHAGQPGRGQAGGVGGGEEVVAIRAMSGGRVLGTLRTRLSAGGNHRPQSVLSWQLTRVLGVPRTRPPAGCGATSSSRIRRDRAAAMLAAMAICFFGPYALDWYYLTVDDDRLVLKGLGRTREIRYSEVAEIDVENFEAHHHGARLAFQMYLRVTMLDGKILRLKSFRNQSLRIRHLIEHASGFIASRGQG